MVYTYTGIGGLIPAVLLAGFIGLISAGVDVLDRHRWAVTVLFIVVGIACWVAEKQLNPPVTRREKIPSFQHYERQVIAPHELLSLRIEYWAPIFIVIGILYWVLVTAMLYKFGTRH